MQFEIMTVVKETFMASLKNIPSFLGAAILWLLTCWIPYINVGTSICLFYAIPIEISKGEIVNPLSIFDGKYRKYMGEFFNIIGMMAVSIIPAMMFMLVPGIIISIGWCLAICLMIDKEINPAEAMTLSTKCTYGHKWAIFGSAVLIGIIWLVAFFILGGIAQAIGVGFISFLVFFVLIAVLLTLNICFTGIVYRYLGRPTAV